MPRSYKSTEVHLRPDPKFGSLLASKLINKIMLEASDNFWEADGMDPAMWTDTALGEVRALRQSADSNEITGLVARARGFTICGRKVPPATQNRPVKHDTPPFDSHS